MDPLAAVAVAVWAMLPAYLPNNVAVVAGGGRPIDGGRTWNGKRLLGDGKTWRGTAAGSLVGVAAAFVLNAVEPGAAAALGVDLPQFPLAAAVTLPVGAMLGDILASFLKRRTGRERGAPFPGVDQLDFVVVSLTLTALVAPEWFVATFVRPILVLVVVLLATPALHLLTNLVAYLLELKSEPY